MAEDAAENVPIDEFDAELDDLFSAFDGMGASDALKAKTLGAIAAAGAAVGAAAAGVVGVQSAAASASGLASGSGVVASAGGKAAAKAASVPIKVAQTVAIAACVSAAVVGGVAYVSGGVSPDQALDVPAASSNAEQGSDVEASSAADQGDSKSNLDDSGAERGDSGSASASQGADAERGSAAGAASEPTSGSGDADVYGRSSDNGYYGNSSGGSDNRPRESAPAWQDDVKSEKVELVTVPEGDDYGVQDENADEQMGAPVSLEAPASSPDWGQLPDDWSKLPDSDSAWQDWQRLGWGSGKQVEHSSADWDGYGEDWWKSYDDSWWKKYGGDSWWKEQGGQRNGPESDSRSAGEGSASHSRGGD